MWLTDDEIHDELRGTLDVQARLLYGLIHARWIVTARGLAKMVFLVRFVFEIPLHRHPIIVSSSSRNTRKSTSGAVRVSFANPNHSSLSV